MQYYHGPLHLASMTEAPTNSLAKTQASRQQVDGLSRLLSPSKSYAARTQRKLRKPSYAMANVTSVRSGFLSRVLRMSNARYVGDSSASESRSLLASRSPRYTGSLSVRLWYYRILNVLLGGSTLQLATSRPQSQGKELLGRRMPYTSGFSKSQSRSRVRSNVLTPLHELAGHR